MNPSSTNAKRKEKGYRCSYCERVFDNYQDFEDHHRLHKVEFKRRINQINPTPDQHGNVSMKSLYGGSTSNNPFATNGNSFFMSPYYSSTITNNNASLEAAIHTKGTIPFSQYLNQNVKNPFYSGFSNNHMGPSNPFATKGNSYGGSVFMPPNYSSTGTNNASIQTKGTFPFSYHPTSNNNHIGHAPSASSAALSRQFQFFGSNFQNIKPNDNNLPYPPVFARNPSLPGYEMTGFGLSKFPSLIEPGFVNTQTHSVDQTFERGKKHNRDEVQEKSPMMNPPKRPNTNSGPLVLQKKDEEKNGSTSNSANHVEEPEADLDLSLHLHL